MLKIRLQRVGRKHEPTFRVVLTDSRNSTKSGRFLEVLGHHDPRGQRVGVLDKDRILHLISKGAQPTATVHNFLVKKSIVKGAKINVSAKRKKVPTPEGAGVPTSQEASVGKKESRDEAVTGDSLKSSDEKGVEKKEEKK